MPWWVLIHCGWGSAEIVGPQFYPTSRSNNLLLSQTLFKWGFKCPPPPPPCTHFCLLLIGCGKFVAGRVCVVNLLITSIRQKLNSRGPPPHLALNAGHCNVTPNEHRLSTVAPSCLHRKLSVTQHEELFSSASHRVERPIIKHLRGWSLLAPPWVFFFWSWYLKQNCAPSSSCHFNRSIW